MWLFTGVLNAGLQILLSIAGGWLCARLKFCDQEALSRNVNLFAMKAAYPAFIIHLLGIKTDLRDGQAWKALGVFVLWVFIIHAACYIYHRLRGGKSSVLQLGLNCLLLTTNNTGCIGWPVLIATVGQQSAVLSMLLGVLFFIQLLPVTICCFEYHKWQQSEGHPSTAATGSSRELDDLHAGDQLPVAQSCKDNQLVLPATATGFPHEFRYCYWSNEVYRPNKAHQQQQQYEPLPAGARQPAALAQVCVDDTDSEAADHHCYGGGSTSKRVSSSSGRFDSSSSRSSTGGGSSSNISNSTAREAPGLEWWRSGSRAAKPQSGGLKRAKDSCDSLYTPFAAAAVVAKQAELEQQMQHRPSTLGLSSLTKRLSKGLSAAGAAAAAAVSAASPSSLMRAASLHAAGQLTPKAAGLSKAASLKPAASLRRTAAAGKDRDPLCQMSVPLMSEHLDEPLSCGAVHRTPSPPSSPPEASNRTAAAGTQPAAAAAAGRRRSFGSHSVSDSDAAAASSSSDGSKFMAAAPARPAAATAVAVQAATAVEKPLSRLPGLAGQQLAGDSAVELHFMGETLVDDEQQRRQQQQQQMVADNAVGTLPAVQSFADLAARGTVSSNGSFGSLHTLGGENSCGRINSDTARISSRTNLLPCSGISSSVVKGASKLGQGQDRAAPPPSAAAAVPDTSSGSGKVQQQQGRSVLCRFVQRHPLLCHIVWNQAQSFHLWLNVLAIVLSVTGVRAYLDPQSAQAIPALGFVDGVLGWFFAACIPTLLFANGVWMCGKDVLCGGWRGQVQVLSVLLLKLTVLPALMIGLTLLCNIRGEYGLSLVLLASCPLAPLAFLVCQQYGFGAELATSITIQGVLLMLPQMMALIKINQLGGLYDVPALRM